jgi:S-formylglutathione hydrolase FrmB
VLPNLTRNEALERAALVTVDSYRIALDLTTGDKTFRSVTTVEFEALPGADTYIDLAADRAHRAIAGLSMGGYGAITLALAHPDRFAAAASHSGVLSPRLLPGKVAPDADRYAASMAQLQQAARTLWTSQRQAFGPDTIAWRARDPIVMLGRLPPRVQAGQAALPALYFDVGADDPWLLHNRDFNAALATAGVPRRYGEFTGGHTWTYWRVHAEDSLEFLLAIVGKP